MARAARCYGSRGDSWCCRENNYRRESASDVNILTDLIVVMLRYPHCGGFWPGHAFFLLDLTRKGLVVPSQSQLPWPA